jgi:hypothetical protein
MMASKEAIPTSSNSFAPPSLRLDRQTGPAQLNRK